MPEQTLILKAKGLYTFPNEFSEVPEGALAVADNISIDADGIIETRRGFDYLSGSGGSRYDSMTTYGGYLYWYKQSASTVYRVDASAGTLTALSGSFSRPAINMRFAIANQDLYFVATTGVFKIDSASNTTPVLSGAPKGLDVQGALANSSGFLSGDTQVAYEALWGYRDANQNLILGAPGPRCIVVHPKASVAIGGLVRATNVVTVTTSSAHPFTTGQSVQITKSGSDANFADGVFTVTVTGSTTFTYSDTGSDAASAVAATATAAAGRDVGLSVTIPSGITSSYFYQVYRTNQTAGQDIAPDDNYQLVFEANAAVAKTIASTGSFSLTSNVTTATTTTAHGYTVGMVVNVTVGSGAAGAGFTSGFKTITVVPSTTTFKYAESHADIGSTNSSGASVTPVTMYFVDQVTDALRQAELYTNPNQEGALQGNERPPIATDIAQFKGCMFYANTTGKHRLELSLLSVGGSQGIQIGDTVSLNGVTFTAASAENVATASYLLDTSSASPTANIVSTVASLLRVANQYTSNTTFYAYSVASENTFPGTFIIEARTAGGSAMSATASAHGSAWQPALPTSGTTIQSSQDGKPGRLYYSKDGEPESVPLLNYFDVGALDVTVRRIIPLRDALFIFKDDGCWRLTGDDPTNFRVDVFDPTIKIVGSDSAVQLANSIYMLTNQGVVSVADTGSSIVSRPIEGSIRLMALNTDEASQGAYYPHGIAYEADRKYILMSSGGAFVYNILSNTWTTWSSLTSFYCGTVFRDTDILYLSTSVGLLKERKNSDPLYPHLDFSDQTVQVATTAGGSGTKTITGYTGGAQVGSMIAKTANGGLTDNDFVSIVTAVHANTLTIETTETWTNGAPLYARTPISVAVQWVAQAGGSPGASHQFREFKFLIRRSKFDTAALQISTEVDPNPANMTLSSPTAGAWGEAGGAPWGDAGAVTNMQPANVFRCIVPQDMQRASALNIYLSNSTALSHLIIEGLIVTYRTVSDRGVR